MESRLVCSTIGGVLSAHVLDFSLKSEAHRHISLLFNWASSFCVYGTTDLSPMSLESGAVVGPVSAGHTTNSALTGRCYKNR